MTVLVGTDHIVRNLMDGMNEGTPLLSTVPR